MGDFLNIGKIYFNKYGDEFIVVGKNYERSTEKHIYYDVVFIKTGYKTCSRTESINNGSIIDRLKPSCCGVGAVGYLSARKNNHLYRIWENMLYRCYSKADKSYKYYGEKGVKVCARWHRFDYFAKDAVLLPGFDKNLFKEFKLRLDKDVLSIGTKEYSPATVMWVSDKQNQKQRTVEYNNKRKKFAIFPDGHIELIQNVSDFCKTHNLHRQNVNLCLQGKQNGSNGFKFYKE